MGGQLVTVDGRVSSVDLEMFSSEQLIALSQVCQDEVERRARRLARPGARCRLLRNRGQWPEGQIATIEKVHDSRCSVVLATTGASWYWYLAGMEVLDA